MKPKIVVIVQNGLVEKVYSDVPTDIIIIDKDNDGVPDNEMVVYPSDTIGEPEEIGNCYTMDGKDYRNYTGKVFKKVLPQLK